MPGKKYASIERPKVYEAVKEQSIKSGMSERAAQEKAAKIANSPPAKKGSKK